MFSSCSEKKYQGTLTSKKMKNSRRLVKDPERYKTVLCATWTVTGQCPYGRKCQFAHGKEELRSRQMNGVQQRATQPIWPPLPVGPPPSTCFMLPTPYALLQPTSIPFGPPDPIDPHAMRAAQAVARTFSCRQIAPPLPPGPPPPLLPKTPPDSVGEPVTVPPSAVELPPSSSAVSEHAELQEFENLLRSSAMYLSDVSALDGSLESLELHVRKSRVR